MGCDQSGVDLIQKYRTAPAGWYISIQPLDIRHPPAQHNHLRVEDIDDVRKAFAHAFPRKQHRLFGFAHHADCARCTIAAAVRAAPLPVGIQPPDQARQPHSFNTALFAAVARFSG